MNEDQDEQEDPAWWIDRVVEGMEAPRSPMPVADLVVGSFRTFSEPAAVECDDGNTYIVKGPHPDPNEHLRTRAAFTDQVVGRLGGMMGAPVPLVTLVELPADLVHRDRRLQHFIPGPAHACREVPNVRNWAGLQFVDANRERFSDLAVLYGWCSSFDEQYLYEMQPPHLVYSADHGHFLPGGPDWTRRSLRGDASSPIPEVHILGGCGLSREMLTLSVSKLRGINDADLASVVALPPRGWGIPVSDRIEVGMFLSRRRTQMIRAFRLTT